MSKRCSYNGYILPALPEWIRAKYPYAFIGKNALFNPSYYYLVAVDKVGYIGMYGGEDMFGPGYTLGAYGLGDSEKLLTRCDWFVAANSEAIEDIEDTFPGITDTEWLLDKENYKNVSCGGTSQNIIWSNHDILNEDGTLRIAASDPIPVEEETPTVMLLGWLVGRQIAGQRSKPRTDVWETIIDKEVTQTADTGYVALVVSDYLAEPFKAGDNVRCTVDGVTETYVADGNSLGATIGSVAAVLAGEGDYYFTDMSAGLGSGVGNVAQCGFRNDGTHHIKVEVNRVILSEWNYNGTILGELPANWDRETYPYAVIMKYDEKRYIFRAYSAPLDAITPDTNGYTHKPPTGTVYFETNCYHLNLLWWNRDEAKTGKTNAISSGKVKCDTIVWANFDILNLDGSMYLGASEPTKA